MRKKISIWIEVEDDCLDSELAEDFIEIVFGGGYEVRSLWIKDADPVEEAEIRGMVADSAKNP